MLKAMMFLFLQMVIYSFFPNYFGHQSLSKLNKLTLAPWIVSYLVKITVYKSVIPCSISDRETIAHKKMLIKQKLWYVASVLHNKTCFTNY